MNTLSEKETRSLAGPISQVLRLPHMIFGVSHLAPMPGPILGLDLRSNINYGHDLSTPISEDKKNASFRWREKFWQFRWQPEPERR